MKASDPTPPAKPTWSPELRTWVSLALFAHLFALIVAVTTYTRPSGLQDRLHDLFEPYLRNLHLATLPKSYPFARFHLGHGMSSDVDFVIEVDVPQADGTTQTISLPDAPLEPQVRLRRYQALANAVGTLATGQAGDDNAGLLPKSLAAAILREHGASHGVIRVRALGIPDENYQGGFEAIARAARENVTDVYEANVIVSDTSVELLRKSTTLEIAPIENRSTRQQTIPATAPPTSVPLSVPPATAPLPPGVAQP